MEFIYAQTLKQKFKVKAHFYELHIGQEVFNCRSNLEIIDKKSEETKGGLPDAVVVMMNPGSSAPSNQQYEPRKFSLCEVFSSGWEKDLVSTKPDNAQYQIMRLMLLNNWEYVRILNLSDLRNGNSNDFIKDFERAYLVDSTNPHSIIHDSRRAELKKSLKTKSNGFIIAAWGEVKVLKQAAEKFVEICPDVIGVKLENPWYRYASPYKKDQKLDWLKNMDSVVKKHTP